MTIPFLNLAREYESLADEINEAALRVLASGWYILGKELTAFEEAFSVFLGKVPVVGVGSGTDALFLALRASGIGPGDGVLTVPNTAVPTVTAIHMCGATPIFVDIDPQTHTLSPTALRKRLESGNLPARPRAVIPVHLYGHPCDMDPILVTAQEFNLKVIEDVAQAAGATYRGRPVGTIGDFGCFSFYPTKNLGACGDAGAVSCRTPSSAARIIQLRNYGEEGKFNNVCHGVNSRLDEIQAAILRAKLAHLADWNTRRQRFAGQLSAAITATGVIKPRSEPWGSHVYHLYVIQVEDRSAVQASLAEAGVQTAIHYPRLIYRQPVYSAYADQAIHCPEAETVNPRILSLPLSAQSQPEEIVTIAASLNQALRPKE